MTLTMRKLTVYVVFRLNYNRPDSNLHSFVSFENCRFITIYFTMWCRGARPTKSCIPAQVTHLLCCRFSTILDVPSGSQVQFGSAFPAPFYSLLYWTLST